METVRQGKLQDKYKGKHKEKHTGWFLPVPPYFQYQNEKQVAANQDYFFKKFSM